MTILGSPTKPLLLGATFTTPHPGGARPLSLPCLLDAMFNTDCSRLVGVAAMHPAMFNWINWLDMVWSAARVHMAFVVNVLPRGVMQRLVNKAMNLLQLSPNADVPVAITVFGTRPDPTFPVRGNASIKPQERFMCEHFASIQIVGFNARQSGSVHESAVPKGCAHD